MAIDRKDVMAILNGKPEAEKQRVEYRSLSITDTWRHLEVWLNEQRAQAVNNVESLMLAHKLSNEYSHERLLSNKVLLDITQAQLAILDLVIDRVKQYHSQEDIQ